MPTMHEPPEDWGHADCEVCNEARRLAHARPVAPGTGGVMDIILLDKDGRAISEPAPVFFTTPEANETLDGLLTSNRDEIDCLCKEAGVATHYGIYIGLHRLLTGPLLPQVPVKPGLRGIIPVGMIRVELVHPDGGSQRGAAA